MKTPLWLQVQCDFPLGRMIHKFEDLSAAWEEIGGRTLSQRVAVCALRLFVIFPLLMISTAASLIASTLWLFPAVIAIPFTGGVFFKEVVCEIIALIVFPILTLSSMAVGKLPPANRISPPHHNHIRICESLKNSEGHLACELTKEYFEERQEEGQGSEAVFNAIINMTHTGSSWEHYPAYRALRPFAMQLTSEKFNELLFESLRKRSLSLSTLLLTLRENIYFDERIRKTQDDLRVICERCNQLIESHPNVPISNLILENLELFFNNETLFKLISRWLPMFTRLTVRNQIDVNESLLLFPRGHRYSSSELFEKLKERPSLKELLSKELAEIYTIIQEINVKFPRTEGKPIKEVMLASTTFPSVLIDLIAAYANFSKTSIKVNHLNDLSALVKEMAAWDRKRDRWGEPWDCLYPYEKCAAKLGQSIKTRIYLWHLNGSKMAASVGAFLVGAYVLAERFVVRPIVICGNLLIALAARTVLLFSSLCLFCGDGNFHGREFAENLFFLLVGEVGMAVYRLGETLFLPEQIREAVDDAVNVYTRCAYMSQKQK